MGLTIGGSRETEKNQLLLNTMQTTKNLKPNGDKLIVCYEKGRYVHWQRRRLRLRGRDSIPTCEEVIRPDARKRLPVKKRALETRRVIPARTICFLRTRFTVNKKTIPTCDENTRFRFARKRLVVNRGAPETRRPRPARKRLLPGRDSQ